MAKRDTGVGKKKKSTARKTKKRLDIKHAMLEKLAEKRSKGRRKKK